MSKIALIDFKDSFTFNIYHYLVSSTHEITVFEDGRFEIEELEEFDKIVLSPGPGLPSETVSMKAILDRYAASKCILGICLGMQGLVEYFGGSLFNQVEVKHGVKTQVSLVANSKLFVNIPLKFDAGLYHSWACQVDTEGDLNIIALSADDIIMAVEHKNFPIFGIQFHPESILTDYGKEIVTNFVNL